MAKEQLQVKHLYGDSAKKAILTEKFPSSLKLFVSI